MLARAFLFGGRPPDTERQSQRHEHFGAPGAQGQTPQRKGSNSQSHHCHPNRKRTPRSAQIPSFASCEELTGTWLMGRMRTEAKSPRKQMVREGSIWKVPGKGPPASLCLLLSQFGRRPLGGKWLFSHQWAGTLTGPLRMESSAERVFGGTTPNFKQRKGHHAEKSVAQGGRTRKRVSSYRVRHWQSERRGVGASTTPGSEKYSSACSRGKPGHNGPVADVQGQCYL